MGVTQAWPSEFRFVDANGDTVTVSGVTLTTGIEIFEAGTSTQKNSYPTQADAVAGTNANANPLAIADGLPANQVWVDGLYKSVVKYGSVTITTDNRGDASDANVFDKGHISGFVISKTAAQTLSVTTGEARDDADTFDISKSTTTSIDLTASGAGGLDTGSVADDDYHIWMIADSSGTNAVSAVASASASSPTLPSGYDKKRRVGGFTHASNVIAGFSARELAGGAVESLISDPPLDVDVTNLGTSSTNYALSIPLGVKMTAIMNMIGSNGSGSVAIIVRSPDADDEAPSNTAAPLLTMLTDAVNEQQEAANVHVRTDTSAQIAARANAASTTFKVVTLGWIDERL